MSLLKTTLAGLCLAGMSIGHAAACTIVYGYEYRMDDGAYRTALNGVLLRRTTDPGDYSGGGSFYQWLLAGENTFSLTMEQGSAEVSLTKGCDGSFDREKLVEATVGAGETRDLTFFADSAPAAVYDENEELTDEGLAEAVAALKAATAAKDVDAYITLHEGLIMQAAASGMPAEAMEGMMSMGLNVGEATMNDDLVYTPVMGGKVWQVLTPDYEPPIKIRIESEGVTMNTGAYWTRIDGEWRVTGN